METLTLKKETAEDGRDVRESFVTTPTKFAEVNGAVFAYRTTGKGTPIILAPRFRANLDDWDPAFLDDLARDFQVIIFDYRGFAGSTGRPDTSILDFATDIKDIAAALGFTKVVAGGWSFGGKVAAIAAMQWPELISHAVLIGSNPPGMNEDPIEPAFFDVSRRLSYTLEDETYLFFEPAAESSRKAAAESRERLALRTEDRDVKVPAELWDNYTSGIMDYTADPYNARQALLETTVPVLVIMGDHDICFPVANWFRLVRSLPTTQLVVMPRSGHGPQHEHPRMIARYIKHFVENTESKHD